MQYNSSEQHNFNDLDNNIGAHKMRGNIECFCSPEQDQGDIDTKVNKKEKYQKNACKGYNQLFADRISKKIGHRLVVFDH
jgi:hypothetical protein